MRTNTGKLKCCECGKQKRFRITDPAAPMRSMCEEAAKHGWSHETDYFAALTGEYVPRCRKCSEA